MQDVIVKVEGLGKCYRIAGAQSRTRYAYKTLQEDLAGLVRQPPWRRDDTHEYVWALKDISFEARRGEVIGVIGANGAGKSTLLKLLSRITEPTEGFADLRGRTGSLLEVGTGFHPELTGRENIFLNGAILGMRHSEVERKFDEIVEFAGVEQFIETPVKRYSSGMHMRLAFAVAAHLEPEILIVDEVLAVGDAEFQKRCLGKMQDVAKSGRTILFVSHNMGAVSRLCDRAILLDRGALVAQGSTSTVVESYLDRFAGSSTTFTRENDENSPLSLLEAAILSDDGALEVFPRHEDVRIRLKYRINREISSVHMYMNLLLSDGTVAFGTSDADLCPNRFGVRKPGTYVTEFAIPGKILNEGHYFVNVSIGIPYQRNFQENNGILAFSLVDVVPDSRQIHQRRAGIMRLDLPWSYPYGAPFETPDYEGQE